MSDLKNRMDNVLKADQLNSIITWHENQAKGCQIQIDESNKVDLQLVKNYTRYVLEQNVWATNRDFHIRTVKLLKSLKVE